MEPNDRLVARAAVQSVVHLWLVNFGKEVLARCNAEREAQLNRRIAELEAQAAFDREVARPIRLRQERDVAYVKGKRDGLLEAANRFRVEAKIYVASWKKYGSLHWKTQALKCMANVKMFRRLAREAETSGS